MKNRKCLLLFFIVVNMFALLSCSKEIEENLPPLLEDLKLSQPEVLAADVTGITLQFYFEGFGNSDIEEYGIVWYEDENKELLQNCVKSFYGNPQKRRISLSIENGLPVNKIIYIRAYAKTGKSIYYGSFVSVQSKGGKKPSINSILPEKPQLSQQIKLEGEGFIQTLNPRYQSVLINDFEIEPDSVTESEIFFTLPEEYIESYQFKYDAKIGIKVMGLEFFFDKECNFISPWRKIDLPGDFSSFAFYRGTATVLNNKAYILFGKQHKKMFVYDIPGNRWNTIAYPDDPEQAFFSPQINCYNFTENNKVYSMVDETLYCKSESSDNWEEVTRYPGNPQANIDPFVYFHDGDLYKGNFDTNYNGRGRSFYKYNIASGVWTELTPIPNNGGGIYNYFVFIYEGNIHLGTIRTNEAYDFSQNIRIWSYSVKEDIWSWNFKGEYFDYPVTDNLNTVVSFAVNNQIFMGLGENHDDWPEYCSDKLWKFNPQTRYWNMIVRCPTKINVSTVFIHNNKAYILGTDRDDGFWEKNIYRNKYFYEFDPSLI